MNAASEAGKEELNWFFPQASLWEKSLLECVIPNSLGFVLSTIKADNKVSGASIRLTVWLAFNYNYSKLVFLR